ncbi:MAG: hypothetical protein J7L71_08545 [Spirochaetaceae bacterium]|nr:hypothetical protein [Spirochaetaceae bacterium]
MNYARYKFLITMILIFSINIFANARVINVDKIMSSLNVKTYEEKYDSNHDGNVDYIVRSDDTGTKVMEALDYNHDGIMDDLYFYADGIIIRREVDSNFDMNIDLWVYIKNGSLIEKYEQDLDFDGIIDKVKLFGGDQSG